MVKIKKTKNKGFTLVETLVAISILSLSVLATFTAVQGGLQYSIGSKDQITAFYLIQDGMEFLKNMRDENALRSIGGVPINWLSGIADTTADPCYFGKTCTVDPSTRVTTTCPGTFGSCPVLRLDIPSSRYGYDAGWTATTFKREVQFSPVATNEVLVTMQISWVTRGKNNSFQVSQILFNK